MGPGGAIPPPNEKEENMESVTLASALETEHREIDGGIEAFTAGLAAGKNDPAPLVRAIPPGTIEATPAAAYTRTSGRIGHGASQP